RDLGLQLPVGSACGNREALVGERAGGVKTVSRRGLGEHDPDLRAVRRRFAIRRVMGLEINIGAGGDELRRVADREVLTIESRIVLGEHVTTRTVIASPSAAAPLSGSRLRGSS